MLVTDILATKRDGGVLSADQIRHFLRGYTDGSIPDYQAAALLMAIYHHGMNPQELAVWTDGMLHSGDVVDLSDVPGYKVDKHSTGGVGDKISLPLAPLVAAAGVPVPMISGRGLGHTGGTLDKLESIPGFNTQLDEAKFRDLVATLGCGLIGQTPRIAPADKKLYALRDVTATVSCIPLIASSILSKKLAEGINGLVLDIKTGSGAFLPNDEDARTLARTMIGIANAAGTDVTALLTDMGQPLGRMVGNALEVVESVEVLRGGGPADVRALTLELGVEMLMLADRALTRDAAWTRLEGLLDGGQALERFRQIVEAQGGDPRAIDDLSRLPTAKRLVPLYATEAGYVQAFANADIGRAALVLGAGRQRKEDAVDPAVGIAVEVKRGDLVKVGDLLATLHVHETTDVSQASAMFLAAIQLGEEAPAAVPLVRERLSSRDTA